jgi:hypothetical protein
LHDVYDYGKTLLSDEKLMLLPSSKRLKSKNYWQYWNPIIGVRDRGSCWLPHQGLGVKLEKGRIAFGLRVCSTKRSKSQLHSIAQAALKQRIHHGNERLEIFMSMEQSSINRK